MEYAEKRLEFPGHHGDAVETAYNAACGLNDSQKITKYRKWRERFARKDQEDV